MESKRSYKKVSDSVSLEAQERLVQIMNDSPSLAKLKGTEWEIRALKPAVQWMIAEEAVKIKKEDSKTFGDVVGCFVNNLPSVIRILTLALLNDEKKIKYEYQKVYDSIYWESNPDEWAPFLLEVLNLLSIEFFFATTNVIQMFREVSLKRKTKMEEQRQLLREQSGGK